MDLSRDFKNFNYQQNYHDMVKVQNKNLRTHFTNKTG